MAEAPAYVILGRGRWAQKMEVVLAGEKKKIATISETRQRSSETDASYVSRLAEAMKASQAEIAWLCVSPGPHVSLMIQAGLDAGLHVIAEKPWYGSAADTERLQALARARGRLIGVHFEYLVHGEVEKWKSSFYRGSGLRFGGHFFLGRADHLGLPAIDNLGCHLFAIREFVVPASEIVEMQCAFERPDERLVWLEQGGRRIASINLFKGSEGIIQDFMKKVEAALDGAAFPFDLDFALRVANQLNAFKQRIPA
ncbi:MAG TPA: Gfo/Idh/MocA family oxidoreductase [Candidatus Acidoferrum sp.]|nr:Gfo/Idh/MocA family oxidoreductase [Candidatus Acidoferrum sp.]